MVKFRLKVLRAERDMTQTRLVELTGIRRPTISAIENNSTKVIKLDHIDRICQALNCNPADLFLFTNQESYLRH